MLKGNIINQNQKTQRCIEFYFKEQWFFLAKICTNFDLKLALVDHKQVFFYKNCLTSQKDHEINFQHHQQEKSKRTDVTSHHQGKSLLLQMISSF
jgi:phosphoenolpyruvate carboxylase